MVDGAGPSPVEERAEADDRRPSERRRLEIVHESLLTEWPRLVRWRTQDADGAQLRDQLRQAARMWIERGRPEDLLWTGTSYGEYALWRERYAGGLSETEEAFAEAMTARSRRRRRQRRLAVGGAFALLLAVLAVVWGSRQQAVEASRRSEASKLLALAQLELESYATGALAYATASLELADTPETRLFALRALSNGPPATVLAVDEIAERLEDGDPMARATFSPGGEWLALEGGRNLWILSRDASTHRHLGSFPSTTGMVSSAFTQEGDALLATKGGELGIWSVPGFDRILERRIPGVRGVSAFVRRTEAGFFAVGGLPGRGEGGVVATPLSPKGEPGPMKLLGQDFRLDIDPTGRWLGFVGGDDRQVLVRPVDDEQAPPRLVGTHEEEISFVRFHPAGGRLAAFDSSGEVRIWSVEPSRREPLLVLKGGRSGSSRLTFDGAGDRLAAWRQSPDGGYLAQVWDLRVSAEASPLTLVTPGPSVVEDPAFSPDGQWLTTNHALGRAFWPLSRSEPMVLEASGRIGDLAFTSDGEHLVSTAGEEELREWDLAAEGRSRLLGTFPSLRKIAVDPQDRFALISSGNLALVVPFDGGPVRELEGLTQFVWPVALDAEGRRAAAASLRGPPEEKAIRIWDLETGETRTLGPVDTAGEGFAGAQFDFRFLPGGRMVSVGDGGLRLWDLVGGSDRVLAPSFEQSQVEVFDGGRFAAFSGPDLELTIVDLESGKTRVLASHGSWAIAVDPTGTTVVSGDGEVKVGRLTGEEPHLLLGHEGTVSAVAISPDGRWIASGGFDGTIRLWPMPDLSRPPLHTLPCSELIAKLRSLTNVRAVRDPEAATGWKLGVDPFPGWEQAPTW